MTCRRSWEMQAIDEGRLAESDVAAFERHAITCSTCHEELMALAKLRSLTRQLSLPGPSELEVRRLRASVLRDAMSTRPSHRVRLLAGALGLAVIATVTALAPRPNHPAPMAAATFGGVVSPAPRALWTQSLEGNVEHVTLTDGDLGLRVRKQADGERFVVTVPDGEVEVRGTTFEVSVHDGRTSRVHVDDGIVIVRVHGELTLSAGQTWSAPLTDDPNPSPPMVSSASSIPAPPAAAPPAVRDSTSPRPRSGNDSASLADHDAATRRRDAMSAADTEMSDYEQAVDAYRLGRFQQAADLLHQFALAHASSPLVDDAAFIEAASVANAGQPEAAARLAERYLIRFPNSFHNKDAAVLVARFRRDNGDCTGARRVLAPWLGAPPPDPAIISALGHCAKEQ
jgi:hypothetical protein